MDLGLEAWSTRTYQDESSSQKTSFFALVAPTAPVAAPWIGERKNFECVMIGLLLARQEWNFQVFLLAYFRR